MSDIHGNSYALTKVLQDVNDIGISDLFIMGDIVGYYFWPDKVIQQLSSFKWTFIKGNHELFLQKSLIDKLFLENVTKTYGPGIKVATENLTSEEISFLVNSDERLVLKINGLSFMFCHACPWDLHTHIYPDSSEQVLKKFLDFNEDYFFIGHSHRQFEKKFCDKIIINIGSVGQNREVGGVANWAILDTDTGLYELKQSHYDVKPLINELENISDKTDYLLEVLMRQNEK